MSDASSVDKAKALLDAPCAHLLILLTLDTHRKLRI